MILYTLHVHDLSSEFCVSTTCKKFWSDWSTGQWKLQIITSLIQVYNNICKMLESNANEQILTLQVAWKKMLA
jgi:hypothetical protein